MKVSKIIALKSRYGLGLVGFLVHRSPVAARPRDAGNYGRIVIRDGGEVVDLSQVGPAGHAIPRFTDDIEIVSSDAAFILVIEKQSVAFQLAQLR